MSKVNSGLTRRHFAIGAMSAVTVAAGGSIVHATEALQTPPVRRNISSFRIEGWQDHFDTLSNGAILADTTSRVVQYWSEDESIYKVYPSSVPMTEDLTRLGMTRVTRKVDGPTWRPTPSMLERNPELPAVVGPGPDNPLGTHALYLSWQYYRVHGTGDTRKIGRRSSSGCIGLYNEHIAELFDLAVVGTQVKLI
ncbi:L,D-transpeptidase [Cochlodiniinecator piscidefendens]|uniref:L,D-transpeptidase n=1 Tax=Cochlodiniinecator piscidefendens TaxID=2715756 RepID=UPI00140CB6A7|nr:L,D-transpeptidase [Cochlodiniinecator piscidefendens]